MSSRIKNNSDFYVVGGTMKPDAPSYVERKADQELYEHILKGDFCYVLTPRQMGKSSLMARTSVRLKKEGVRTAIIDLTQIGTEKEKTSADKWYYGIAYRIVRELGIKTKLSHWWQEREKLPALQRLTEFFEDVLLPGTNEPVVIFVDEIDTTIALPFTDDFFAAVRACYNARAAKTEYQRLNFVLLGVANPSDLIKDTQRTPFNIGHGIHLTDFTPGEAKPLSLGLCADPVQGEKMLARILYWTGGHPYLTQKLCRIAGHEKLEIYSDEVMDNLVEKNFLSPGANRQEPNLKFVSDRLLQDRKNSRKRLKLYRRIYNEKVVLDDPLSPTHASLKLSGLVVPGTTDRLNIRNRIYERTFTGEWIKEVIPTDWNRNIAVAAAALLLIGIVIYFALLLPEQYIKDIRLAQEDAPIDAYDKLKGFPFYKTTAEKLLADYWNRCALRSLSQGERDEGLIYHLKAMTIKESAVLRSEAGQVIGDDYKNLMVTYRHNSEVLSVAFSPGGKTVLTGSADGTARLWQADTGKPLSSPIKHGDRVNSVAFSPDGKTLLTGGLNGTVQLWETASGKSLGSIMKNDNFVPSIAFSPDGKSVLTGSPDGAVRWWEAATGKLLTPPMKHGDFVPSVAFSPDGKILLTGSWDGKARLWSAALRKQVSATIKHGDFVIPVAFSPNGKILFTGSLDGIVQLWDVLAGKPLVPPMKRDLFTAVAFSPDGKTLFIGSIDGTVRLWEAASGKPLTLLAPMKHNAYISSFAFGPDGKILLTGSDDGTVRLWEVTTGKPLAPPMKQHSKVESVAISPDGKTLLTGGEDSTAQLWEAATGKPLTLLEPLEHKFKLSVNSVAFSPDGKTLLTGVADMVQWWDAATGEPLAPPMEHGAVVYSVAFSPDGKTIMAATSLWVHQSTVTGARIKPKDSRLLPGRWTGAYRFLDDKGDHMQVAVRVTGDSIKIINLRFDKPDAPPIEGDPEELLKEWQKKLALKLDEKTGKIEAMYPLPEVKEDLRRTPTVTKGEDDK